MTDKIKAVVGKVVDFTRANPKTTLVIASVAVIVAIVVL